jgi:tRNA-splicing ligase RtcB
MLFDSWWQLDASLPSIEVRAAMEESSTKIKIFGEHEEATRQQIERCVAAGAERGVLCADGHKGYAQPIGGVVAYRDKISLSGVGFDIACGNLAIRTDAAREQIDALIPKIMDDIVRDISFGIGRAAKVRIDHELFDDPAWELRPLRDLKSVAAEQLGTVGGGNHYVDLFADEEDRIWSASILARAVWATKPRHTFLRRRAARMEWMFCPRL